MTRESIITFLLAAALVGPALAQEKQASKRSEIRLPPACQTAAQSGGQGGMMRDKMSQMQAQMQGNIQPMLSQMSETQKELAQIMMDMNQPMMMGMTAQDADVAWICAMIPHHQGAIEMARAGLKGGDDAQSKKLAEETISENQKSIKKLMAWLEKHAGTESKNETTGSKK